MAESLPLAGWTVVLTRPAHAARESIAALTQAGAHAICLPVLGIESIGNTPDPAGVRNAHGAVFVSANAVAHGLPPLRSAGFGVDTPCFAVGEATAAALQAQGQSRVIAPSQGFDSEHLLALPELIDVAGKTLLLVKGVGTTAGRALIEDTLTARGARVVTFMAYRRRAWVPDEALRRNVLELLDSGRHVVLVVASGESLQALRDAFGADAQALSKATLAVPHARVAALAVEAGLGRTILVNLPAAGLVESLAAHAAGLKKST
ncbi:MAG: uroporphyrinogen-III synthase [Betaproteobacteria bacterium]|nr:uroporphyrinogen-III synthase [Betaproteobacteria bacterium]